MVVHGTGAASSRSENMAASDKNRARALFLWPLKRAEKEKMDKIVRSKDKSSEREICRRGSFKPTEHTRRARSTHRCQCICAGTCATAFRCLCGW
jgi:hypothetical protein